MGKDNPRVPVTRMGKGMGKNSYPCMSMGKLASKIFFFVGKDTSSTYPVDNYPLPSLACSDCFEAT
jgi:hypothetical protein